MTFDTRPRLLAALQELSRHQPLETITHKDVAKATGLSLPTVQRHLGAQENFAALLQFEQGQNNTSATRERIISAAETVFAEKGYTGASLDMVARSAGMTKGAIYWHFSSKAELFYVLLEERWLNNHLAMEPIIASHDMEKLALPQVQDLLENAIRQIARDPRWPRLFIEFISQAREPEIAEKLGSLYRQSYENTATLHQQVIDFGRASAQFPAHTVAKFWSALIDGLVIAWMVNPETTDMPQLIREFSHIAWVGMRGQSEESVND